MVGIDDLGTPGGHIELPFGAEADRLLNQWDFRAFGNRPQDFASYDAIVGSARRDWRNEHLTELSKNGHPRFANALRRATRAQQKRALASVAWLWTLYRSLAVTLKDFDSPVLRQATICPPPLALVSSRNTDRPRPCGYSHVCQHCAVRKLHRLWKSIKVAAGTVTMRIDIETELDSLKKLKGAKQQNWKRLRDMEVAADMVGGVLTANVGPLVRHGFLERSASDYVFRLRCGFVFQPSDSVIQLIADRWYRGRPLVEGTSQCVVHLHGERDSIRDLIFGSPQNAVPPVIVDPSWPLARPEQWRQLVLFTRKLHQYQLVGEWHKQAKQQVGLRAANSQRKRAARKRFETLRPQVDPVYRVLCLELGRTPGRKPLIEACRRRSIRLSVSHAKKFLMQKRRNENDND